MMVGLDAVVREALEAAKREREAKQAGKGK